MKECYSKLTHIAGEVTNYFLKRSSKDISNKIRILDDYSEITVYAKDLTLTEHDLESMRIQLNNPRQREVEGYYWSLAGGEHEGSEMRLVGTMVDWAEINSDNNNGTIVTMKRY